MVVYRDVLLPLMRMNQSIKLPEILYSNTTMYKGDNPRRTPFITRWLPGKVLCTFNMEKTPGRLAWDWRVLSDVTLCFWAAPIPGKIWHHHLGNKAALPSTNLAGIKSSPLKWQQLIAFVQATNPDRGKAQYFFLYGDGESGNSSGVSLYSLIVVASADSQ